MLESILRGTLQRTIKRVKLFTNFSLQTRANYFSNRAIAILSQFDRESQLQKTNGRYRKFIVVRISAHDHFQESIHDLSRIYRKTEILTSNMIVSNRIRSLKREKTATDESRVIVTFTARSGYFRWGSWDTRLRSRSRILLYRIPWMRRARTYGGSPPSAACRGPTGRGKRALLTTVGPLSEGERARGGALGHKSPRVRFPSR